MVSGSNLSMPENFFALVRAVGSTQAADGQLINRGSILAGDNRLSSALKVQDPPTVIQWVLGPLSHG
jgi:hypothetical protein